MELPDDLFTHEDVWLKALDIAWADALREDCDRSYWDHEKKVFRRVWNDLRQFKLDLEALKGLVKEAADSVKASTVEKDISDDRREYRKQLEQRLRDIIK
jgi:hypothetical protein